MAEDCLTRLMDPKIQKDLFGERKVPQELIKRLLDDIQNIKKAVDQNPELGSYNSRINEYIKEKRQLSEIEKGIKAHNLAKIKKNFDFYTQPAFEKNPVEGLFARLSFSKFLATDSKNSFMNRSAAREGRSINYVLSAFKEKKLEKVAVSGKLDKEAYLAIGGDTEGVSTAGAAFGKIVSDFYDKFFNDMRDAGVPVRYQKGYTPQTHEPSLVKAAGYDSWYNETYPRLDKKGTFGTFAGNPEMEQKMMKQIYKNIIAGKMGDSAAIRGKDIEDTILNTGATRSYSDKLSESRFLRFEGKLNEFEYNEKFGSGNLVENLMHDIRRKSKMIEAVSMFGTNPEASFKADIDRLEAHYKRKGDEAGYDSIRRNRRDAEDLFKEVMGYTQMPGQNTAAKIGQNIRTMNAASKLFYAGISSMSNLASTAVEIKTTTGKNILMSTFDTVTEWTRTLPDSKKVEFQQHANYFIDDFVSEIMTATNTGVVKDGWVSKGMKMMFKLNFLEKATTGAKVAYGNTIMREIHNNIKKEFSTLDPRLRASLMSSGIDSDDFNVMRHAGHKMKDGRMMVTPEAVENLPNLIRSLKEQEVNATGETLKRISSQRQSIEKDIKIAAANKKMSQSQYLTDLELKYSSFLIEGANFSSTSATARERNIINGGTYAGTPWGEIRRLIGQFKTFPIQALYMSQRVLNSKPDEQKLLRGVLMSRGMDQDSTLGRLGKKDFMSFGQLIVGTTLLGYISGVIKDSIKGKGAKDPRDPQTWIDAMASGGAGGLYTDFLAGEYDKFSFTENLLGPTLGQLGPAAKIVTKGRTALVESDEKLGKKVLSETTRLIRNNIPFQQVPLMKQALDYVQYDVIQESLTPGYKARSNARKRRDERDNRVDVF